MKESKMSRVVFPEDANQNGMLFGGKMLAWMDETAGIAARRFAGRPAITAAVEQARFYRQVPVGTFLDVSGKVVHVGNTSMRVQVTITLDAQDPGEEDILAADAVFIYVAVDEEGRPVPVGRRLDG